MTTCTSKSVKAHIQKPALNRQKGLTLDFRTIYSVQLGYKNTV